MAHSDRSDTLGREREIVVGECSDCGAHIPQGGLLHKHGGPDPTPLRRWVIFNPTTAEVRYVEVEQVA